MSAPATIPVPAEEVEAHLRATLGEITSWVSDKRLAQLRTAQVLIAAFVAEDRCPDCILNPGDRRVLDVIEALRLWPGLPGPADPATSATLHQLAPGDRS